MSGVATAIGGAAVIGAVSSTNAANKASNAAQNAANVSQSQFAITQNEGMPFMGYGTQAASYLYDNLANINTPFSAQQYQQSPGYAWQLQQGQNAIQASAAAKGMLNSTGTQQNLLSYSQGLANQDYQQALQNYMAQNQQTYNQYMGMAQLGQNTIMGTGAQGLQSASQAGNAMMAGGNAQAAGMMGMSNAITGAVGQGVNYAGQSNMMNQFAAMQQQNLQSMYNTYGQTPNASAPTYQPPVTNQITDGQ